MEVINGKFGQAKEEKKQKHMGEALIAAIAELDVEQIEEGNFMVLLSTDAGFSIASSQLSGAAAGFMLDMAKGIIIDAALSNGPDFSTDDEED